MKKIKLTKGKYAIIDDKDYKYLSQFNWQYDGFYAGRNIVINNKKTRIRMHSEIMQTPKGYGVDHLNRNRLDNRRKNLKICTQSDNQKNLKKFITNKSGTTNVHWDKDRNKWRVQKCFNGMRKTIGRFNNLKEAKNAAIIT